MKNQNPHNLKLVPKNQRPKIDVVDPMLLSRVWIPMAPLKEELVLTSYIREHYDFEEFKLLVNDFPKIVMEKGSIDAAVLPHLYYKVERDVSSSEIMQESFSFEKHGKVLRKFLDKFHVKKPVKD